MFGIIIESLLILVCVGAFLLVVVIWRVAKDAVGNLVVIGLLFVSQVLILCFWVSEVTQFYGTERVREFEMLLFVPNVIVFIVLLRFEKKDDGLLSDLFFF
jgi:hypothetical protein